MAAFTSKATGNWSSGGQTTWNEVGVPTAGDTVTIQNGHAVTVDSAISIGAGGATGSAAVTVNSGGRLNINFTVNFAGDLIQQRNARIDVAAGVQLLWDMPAGSAYLWSLPNTGTGGNAVININGTANSRVVMKRNSGAAADYVQFSHNFSQPSTITASYFTMEDCGTSSTAAFTIGSNSQAHNWNFTNFLMLNCGQFTGQFSSTTATLNFDGWDVRTSKANTPVNFIHSAAYSSGTRRIRKFTHYATTAKTLVFTLRAYNPDDFRVFNGALSMTTAGVQDCTWSDGVLAWGIGDGTSMQQQRGACGLTFERNVYLKITNDQNNGHNIVDSGNAGGTANVIQDCVMHGGDLTANDDDGVFPKANMIIRRNIFCGNFGGPNLENPIGTSTTVQHNTFVSRSLVGHGYGVIIGELSSDTADSLATCEDNIFAVFGSQSGGEVSCGFQIRTSVNDLPQTTATLRNNGFYFAPTVTASNKFMQRHVALGRVSYIGNSGSAGSNIRVGAFTLAASTAYPVIKSAGLFGSVQVGDVVYFPTRGNAMVASVTDANTLTVDTATANLPSGTPITGDAGVYIQRKLWSGGQYVGQDADHGANDVYGDPGFLDITRSAATWDTTLGGAGSELNAVRELVAVNGIAFDGTSRSASTTYTPTALRTYLQAGFTPTNPDYAVAYAASGSVTWIGAMEGISGASPFQRRRRRGWTPRS